MNRDALTFRGNYNTTPEWSPKGDLIVFTARDERRAFDIFTVNVSSSEITRITQDQGNNEEPSWSPDGALLGFPIDSGWQPAAPLYVHRRWSLANPHHRRDRLSNPSLATLSSNSDALLGLNFLPSTTS